MPLANLFTFIFRSSTLNSTLGPILKAGRGIRTAPCEACITSSLANCTCITSANSPTSYFHDVNLMSAALQSSDSDVKCETKTQDTVLKTPDPDLSGSPWMKHQFLQISEKWTSVSTWQQKGRNSDVGYGKIEYSWKNMTKTKRTS